MRKILSKKSEKVRDYYERRNGQEGSRSGSKPRTIKIGCGEIEIRMLQVRDKAPFYSEILPPRVTCIDEVQDVIPLLYYKYPYRYWKRIRTTNAVERSFREVRQRVRGIGRFKDEERALTMVWWQMKKLRWYGVDMTKEARAILASIKMSKLERIAA
ncbi:MAG: transposase [Nitrospirota bacterium]